MQAQTVQQLNAEIARLEEERERLSGEVDLLTADVEGGAIAAALHGVVEPAESAALRERIDDCKRRLDAIARAVEFLERARAVRQKLDNEAAAAEQIQRTRAAFDHRRRAVDALSASIGHFLQQLGTLQQAYASAEAELAKAAVMQRAGIMDRAVRLRPKRLQVPDGIVMQDRKTGMIRPEFLEVSIADVLRERFEDQVLGFVSTDRWQLPEFVQLWAEWQQRLKQTETAGA